MAAYIERIFNHQTGFEKELQMCHAFILNKTAFYAETLVEFTINKSEREIIQFMITVCAIWLCNHLTAKRMKPHND